MKLVTLFLLLAMLVALVLVPSYLDAYGLGLMVSILGYVTLATAWSMFSGPTGYVSLATVAFFGIGAYTMAVLNETLPLPAVMVCAVVISLGVALLVGMSTLRLAGIYFVIFTFGLAELVRQLITWFEVNITGELGRYIFAELETKDIYWMLLGLAVITLIIAWSIARSRLGLALKVIGDDEDVAAHIGIDLARTKLTLFAISAVIITLVGVIQSPRWVYIEPSIAFNPTISFMTVIMALFGGTGRIWGPAVGSVPLVLLFEWLSANFPNHYSILLGVLFILIVFALPKGMVGLFEKLGSSLRYGNKPEPSQNLKEATEGSL